MSDFGKIAGKNFLITGAASGLGAGYVEPFLKEGAKSVAILDISEEKGNDLVKKLNQLYPGKVLFVKCDVSNEENITAAFNEVVNKFGTVDVVINNAGILNDSPKTWRKQCDLNYTGLVSLTLKSVNHMRVDEGGKGGTIINVSSTLGLTPFPFLPVYSGTKAAVLHFSQSISKDPFHSQTGVRVMTICFGATDTQLLANLVTTGYDEFSSKMMNENTDSSEFQKPESAIKGLVDMFKSGSNGSVWLAHWDRPAVDITSDLKNSTEELCNKYDIIH